MNHYLLIIPTEKPCQIISEIQNIKLGLITALIVTNKSNTKLIEDSISHDEATVVKKYPKKDLLSTGFDYSIENYDLDQFAGVLALNVDNEELTIEDIEKSIHEFETYKKAHPVVGFSKLPENGALSFSMDHLIHLFTNDPLKNTERRIMVLPTLLMQDLYRIDNDGGDYDTNLTLLLNDSHMQIKQLDLTKSYETLKQEHKENREPMGVIKFINYHSVFLKFILSAFSAFIIDIVTFTVVLGLFDQQTFTNIFIATAIGKVISSVANYTINRYVVFRGASSSSGLKYSAIIGVKLVLSSIFVHWANLLVPFIHTSLIKAVIDMGLFSASYIIQKRFVFGD